LHEKNPRNICIGQSPHISIYRINYVILCVPWASTVFLPRLPFFLDATRTYAHAHTTLRPIYRFLMRIDINDVKVFLPLSYTTITISKYDFAQSVSIWVTFDIRGEFNFAEVRDLHKNIIYLSAIESYFSWRDKIYYRICDTKYFSHAKR